MAGVTESVVEQAALAWLESVGWSVRHGAEIAPGELAAERSDYGQVVLEQRLRDALAQLNHSLPATALEDAFRKLTRPEGAELSTRNRAVYRLLVDGVTVEYRTPDGEIRGAQARVLDFENTAANDWLVVNQFTVAENKHSRRPDLVLFVNGLPLAVVELKNAADENATIWTAFQQLQTYKAEIPSLFATNALLVISDGVEARVGKLTAGREWFKPWRTVSGERLADAHLPELQVVSEGVFAPRRFLDLVHDFISKPRREALAHRFRDAADPLRMVLVRDMWLTGFDAPSLHTIYVDKPMRGHGLMQAIARVNRVFKDKPGGLVADYLGLAHELKAALATYTESGGTGRTALDQDEAVAVMIEKYEICCALFYGFDWSKWTSGTPPERLGLLPAAQEHILQQENGKDRWAPEGVVDIFAAAGLEKPNISILSEEFLAEVRDMPHKNLAVELLRKLLQGELRTRRRQNVVQARSFAEMLEQTIRRYQNRAIEAAQVIEELIQLAQDMRQANARGEALGLSEDELAFYDALETNDSAVQVLGDATLRAIAQELVRTVRANVTIDWTLRENVRAQLRVLVKRILRKHGYPPDKQEQATHTVLEQAEVLSAS